VPRYSKSPGFEDFYESLNLLQHRETDYSLPCTEPMKGQFSLIQELWAILRISALTFIVYISWTGLLVTDTAVIGNVNVFYLESISLVQLWTSSFMVFLQARILQIFVSHADGAGNPKEIARWSQFSLIFNSCVAVGVVLAWSLSGKVMSNIYEDKSWDVLVPARYYASVLAFGVPFAMLYRQISQNLRGRQILWPETITTLVGLSLNLITIPLSHGNFLGFHGLGFCVIPIVTVCVQALEVIALLVMMKDISWFFCWSETFSDVLTWERMRQYMIVWFPAVVTFALDTWRFNFIGFIAALSGVKYLAAFNIAVKMMQLSHEFVSALGLATAIRVGHHLGTESRNLATKTCYLGMGMAAVCAMVICLVPLLIPRLMGRIFTSDESVIEIVVNARYAMAFSTFTMSLSVCYSNIMIGQGRPSETMITSFVSSWLVNIPICIILVKVFHPNKPNLAALFWTMSGAFTTATGMSLYFLLFRTNWSRLIDSAVYRANLHAYSLDLKLSRAYSDTWNQVFT